MVCAFGFARLNAGGSMPARMAMIAMTTSSSMRVNAKKRFELMVNRENKLGRANRN